MIPATELWVASNEANAQLELTKDEPDRRHLQLVRYTAVCPGCAEAPHHHVFSFNRISRWVSRVTDASLDNAGDQVTSPQPRSTQPLS